jgi:hypothetical protein
LSQRGVPRRGACRRLMDFDQWIETCDGRLAVQADMQIIPLHVDALADPAGPPAVCLDLPGQQREYACRSAGRRRKIPMFALHRLGTASLRMTHEGSIMTTVRANSS